MCPSKVIEVILIELINKNIFNLIESTSSVQITFPTLKKSQLNHTMCRRIYQILTKIPLLFPFQSQFTVNERVSKTTFFQFLVKAVNGLSC